MKKFLLLRLVCLLSPFSLAAQPVLTAANQQPQWGNIPLRHSIDPDTLFPGPSGSNVTWNYGTIVMLPDPDSVQVLNNPSLPPWFYNTEFNVSNAITREIDYYISAGDSLAYAGKDHDYADFDPVRLFNPSVQVRFPMTYGDQWVDQFAGTHQSIAGPVSFSGISHVEADAFGTMILPGSVFTDVLRIHQHDSVFIGGNYQWDFHTYTFYSASYRYPLLIVSRDSYWRIIDYVETYYNVFTSGTQGPGAVAPITLEPNPFHEALHLTVTAPGTLSIFGMDGREYFKETFTMEISNYKIPHGELSAGVYIASYTNEQGSWQQRIVRQ
jgi:hypothetical protein